MTDETPISASVNARVIAAIQAKIDDDAAAFAHALIYGDGSLPPTGILNAKPPAQPKIRQGARKAELRRRGLR